MTAALPAAPRADGGQAASTVVRIGTLPGLRYDTRSFSVRPGAQVSLVFTNTDEMLHNFVITRPGARERVVQAAIELGAGAADRDFVPASPDVLWFTRLVPTGGSFTLTFTAPTAPGDYPYVCTMPGHGLVMFGTMTVTNTPGPPVMTPLEPTESDIGHDGSVPVADSRGSVMRGFMPDAGPAAIAVQLPGGVSYVWDAGAGRFRYAWLGGNPTMPSSPERGLARVPGSVFYREPSFPLRLASTPNVRPARVEFKGYTLDARGIPEFEIAVDGVAVFERAEVVAGRLIRRFRIPGIATAWFAVPDGVTGLEVTGGVRDGAFYRLSGSAAQEFAVTYVLPAGAGSPAAR